MLLLVLDLVAGIGNYQAKEKVTALVKKSSASILLVFPLRLELLPERLGFLGKLWAKNGMPLVSMANPAIAGTVVNISSFLVSNKVIQKFQLEMKRKNWLPETTLLMLCQLSLIQLQWIQHSTFGKSYLSNLGALGGPIPVGDLLASLQYPGGQINGTRRFWSILATDRKQALQLLQRREDGIQFLQGIFTPEMQRWWNWLNPCNR